jgi:cell volume regulation protein A
VTDVKNFATLVLVLAVVGLLAVLSNRLSERVRLPAPALFLAFAAITENVISVLPAPPERLVERVVTVALLCILFDGGLHLGWRRFRSAAAPVTAIGIAGTFLTAAAAAALSHYAFGLNWYLSLLLGTAVSPTDPAVVFSVLGRREIAGRSGAILEGESGANDPVGIALMASLITAGGVSGAGFLHVAGEFLLQMGVGGAVGVLGGRALLWFMRRVPLPAEGLYPLRTLASAFVIYGAATLALGSGFLAVFIAGIILGDARAPFKREIERFHSALASLAEIVAFIILGLTVDLDQLSHADVWIPGLVLGAAVAFVIRPVLVGLCLWPTSLQRNERTFVLFAGLKGAVPILLASYLLAAGIEQGQRLYGIVVVVVAFSVVFQAGLVPTVARLLRLPMHTVEVEPWALGIRLTDEPEGVDRFTICPGSPADGRTVEQLADLPGEVWVSFVIRDRELLQVRPGTRLLAGDDVLVQTEPASYDKLVAMFETPGAAGSAEA